MVSSPQDSQDWFSIVNLLPSPRLSMSIILQQKYPLYRNFLFSIYITSFLLFFIFPPQSSRMRAVFFYCFILSFTFYLECPACCFSAFSGESSFPLILVPSTMDYTLPIKLDYTQTLESSITGLVIYQVKKVRKTNPKLSEGNRNTINYITMYEYNNN